MTQSNFRRNLWIPPTSWNKVKAEAKRRHISLSEMIRRCIAAYFEKAER